jgi:hypothetical protein
MSRIHPVFYQILLDQARREGHGRLMRSAVPRRSLAQKQRCDGQKLIACKARQHPEGQLRERRWEDRAFALTTGRSSFFTASYGFLPDGAPQNRHLVVTQPLEKTDMPRAVADRLAETLAIAGVGRIYGIVGASPNGLTDTVRRQGKVEWVHVRHGEKALRQELER